MDYDKFKEITKKDLRIHKENVNKSIIVKLSKEKKDTRDVPHI